jgi:hypothetical protein
MSNWRVGIRFKAGSRSRVRIAGNSLRSIRNLEWNALNLMPQEPNENIPYLRRDLLGFVSGGRVVVCRRRRAAVSELTREELEALADEIRPPRAKGARHVEHIFWSKVKRGADTDCWPWQGFRKASGHGLTSYKSLSIHASRKAYILTHGPISSARCVLHRCDNAACCNPSHLYLGTRADNMIDRFGNVKPEYRKATGRARVLTDKQIETLWQMRREGATLKVCATKFDVHLATIARYITIERKRKLEKIRADRLGITQ